MTCNQRQDQILLYAAGALDDAETQDLRRHLATGCPSCTAQLAQARALYSAIPLSLDPISPPSDLKHRLMEKVESTSQSDDLPDSLALRIFRIFVPAAVAAGLAIMITHAFVVARLRPQLMDGQAMKSLVTMQNQQIHSLLQQLSSQKQIVDFLRTPQLKMVDLKPSASQSAAARVIYDTRSHQWLLLATGLAPQPANKTYELWCITADAKKIPAGTFNVDTNGQGSLLANLPTTIGDHPTAAITDEPAGGMQSPTGSIQLVGSL